MSLLPSFVRLPTTQEILSRTVSLIIWYWLDPILGRYWSIHFLKKSKWWCLWLLSMMCSFSCAESWLWCIYGSWLILLFLLFSFRNLAVSDNILPAKHYKQINRVYETKIIVIFIIQNGSNAALNTDVELWIFPLQVLIPKTTFVS